MEQASLFLSCISPKTTIKWWTFENLNSWSPSLQCTMKPLSYSRVFISIYLNILPWQISLLKNLFTIVIETTRIKPKWIYQSNNWIFFLYTLLNLLMPRTVSKFENLDALAHQAYNVAIEILDYYFFSCSIISLWDNL